MATASNKLSAEREKHLVEQVQQGDRGALGELLSVYNTRVYHVCLRMVSKPEDAADLTQEALLRAIRHIDEFKNNSRFGTWLMRIAMNLAVSHLRSAKVRSSTSLDQGGSDEQGPLKSVLAGGYITGPAQQVETREQLGRLDQAIQSLEVSLRSVLVLRDLQEMDYAAIAETLALPVGTVKSRLFRARVALRQAMDERLNV